MKSKRGRGGTGRRKGLKIPRWQRRVGSSPTARTKTRTQRKAEGPAYYRAAPQRLVLLADTSGGVRWQSAFKIADSADNSSCVNATL